MKRDKQFKRTLCGFAAMAALGAVGLPNAYAADAQDDGGFQFALSGYARGWLSMNLENQPELKQFGHKSGGKLSMIRGSVLLDADAKAGPLKLKAIARLDREYKTNYLEDLEDLRETNGTAGGKNITDN